MVLTHLFSPIIRCGPIWSFWSSQSYCLSFPEYSLCSLFSLVSPCGFFRLEYLPPNSEYQKPIHSSNPRSGSFLFWNASFITPVTCSFNVLIMHLALITAPSICFQYILHQEDESVYRATVCVLRG